MSSETLPQKLLAGAPSKPRWAVLTSDELELTEGMDTPRGLLVRTLFRKPGEEAGGPAMVLLHDCALLVDPEGGFSVGLQSRRSFPPGWGFVGHVEAAMAEGTRVKTGLKWR